QDWRLENQRRRLVHGDLVAQPAIEDVEELPDRDAGPPDALGARSRRRARLADGPSGLARQVERENRPSHSGLLGCVFDLLSEAGDELRLPVVPTLMPAQELGRAVLVGISIGVLAGEPGVV